MRHILTLLLTAALAYGQLPVELMRKPSLTRSGLAAGVNLTGGVDTQSIASLPPGTATLVRGANTGASTDDPTVSLAGWTFDSGDRVSGIPAKGANWTTTNCSGVECYTITSAGTEYINGVARRNLFKESENYNALRWSAAPGSFTSIESAGVSPTGRPAFLMTMGAVSYPSRYQLVGVLGTAGVLTVDYKPGTAAGTLVFGDATSPTEAAIVINAETGAKTSGVGTSTALADGWFRLDVPGTQTTAPNTAGFYFSGTPTAGMTFYISAAQFEYGLVESAYQKTTDSREWALETVGNYVGLLTWWGRKDRVIGPGEALNDYRGYIRPTVNARGNTLP